MTHETAPTIDAQAVEWVARIDHGGLDVQTSGELGAWLAADSRRRGALLRAEAAWALLDRARVLSREHDSTGHRLSAVKTRQRQLWRRIGGLAAAAAVVAFAVLSLREFVGHRYATAVGEVRRIALADGSLAEINTSSKLTVALDKQSRVVTLRSGEAWFQVAKDPRRPFIVQAGEVRVRALGTAFVVRRRDAAVEVAVTEGAVEAWVVGATERKLRLGAGSKADMTGNPSAHVVKAPAEIERALAWRSGQLALQGETLGDALAQFNRYNASKLISADPQLAGERLVGWFRINDPQGFADAVGSMLHARVVVDGDNIRLVRGEARTSAQ